MGIRVPSAAGTANEGPSGRLQRTQCPRARTLPKCQRGATTERHATRERQRPRCASWERVALAIVLKGLCKVGKGNGLK